MFLSCKNYAMAIGLFCLSVSGLVATSAGADDAEEAAFVILRIANEQERPVKFASICGVNSPMEETYPLGDIEVPARSFCEINLPMEYAWSVKFQVSGFKKPSGKVVSARRALPVIREFDPSQIKTIVITVKPHKKEQESIEVTTDLRPSVGEGARGRSGTVASEAEVLETLKTMGLADDDADEEHALAGAGAAGTGSSVGAAESNWQRLARLYLAGYQKQVLRHLATKKLLRANWQRFAAGIMKHSNRRAAIRKRIAQQQEGSEDAEIAALLAASGGMPTGGSEEAMATATGAPSGLGVAMPVSAVPAGDLPDVMEEERREPEAGAPLPAGAGTGAGGEAVRDPLHDITNAVAALSLGEGVGVGAAALPAGSESWGAWLARMARFGY